MGDRCYLRVEVHRDDRKILTDDNSLGPPDEEDESNDPTQGHIDVLIYHDINYGGSTDLHEAGSKGARFVAYNGAGGEYGEGLVVGFGGEALECSTVDGEPVVSIRATQDDLDRAHKILEMIEKVEQNAPCPKRPTAKQKRPSRTSS